MPCSLFSGCIDYKFLGKLIDALEIRLEPFADKWLLIVFVAYTYYDDIESAIRAIQKYLGEKGIRSKPREIAPDFYKDLPVLRIVFEINNFGGESD